MIDLLYQKLQRRDARLMPEEKAALEGAVGHVADYAADTDVVREHDLTQESKLLLSGRAIRYGARPMDAVRSGDPRRPTLSTCRVFP